MRKPLTFAIVVGVMLVTLEARAGAQGDRPRTWADSTEDKRVLVITNPGGATPPGPARPAVRPARRPTRPGSSLPGHVITTLRIGDAGDGTSCLSSLTTRRGTPMTRDEEAHNFGVQVGGWLLDVPGCTAAGSAAGAAPTPASVAEPFLRAMPMPVPAPFIGPDGTNITGLAAYLETNGTLVHHVGPQPTELGPLTAVARSRYWVDWGDGSAEAGPFDFEGEAYPNGRIWHLYQYTGTYTITLRQTWTADWALGGDSGTVEGLETEATTTVDVDEIQAVIRR